MKRRLSLFSAVVLSILGLFSGSVRADFTKDVTLEPSANVAIRVHSWLDSCPQVGLAPFRIEIINREKTEHTWDLTVTGRDGAVSSRTMTVAGEHSAVFDHYVMVAAGGDGFTNYRNMSMILAGYGCREGSFQALATSISSGRSSFSAYVAFSNALYVKNWGPVRDRLETAGINLDGTKVDIAEAPTDWRGYTSLAGLWMDESEWLTMTAPAKSAMMDWVALGGRVTVLVKDNGDARLDLLHFPHGTGLERSSGGGKVSAQVWNGADFPLKEVVSEISIKFGSSPAHLLDQHENKGLWSMKRNLPGVSVRAGLIFGFILMFGVLVGPVNLLWFCRPPSRQRLFWTTPLISVLGSLLLMSIMLLQDGLGGTGARVLAVQILPEEKKMVVIQEQVSQTGVLLGKTFAVPEASWMQPLTHERDDSGYPYGYQGPHHYEESASDRSGDWFGNRAMQAHLIETVRPTRGVIEFLPGAEGAAPAVLSSIGAPLEKVFVLEDAKHVWLAEHVGTGERKVLQKSDWDAFRLWLDEAKKQGGPFVREALTTAAVAPRPEIFAESADASQFAVASLPSVRWKHQRVIITCPSIKH